MTSNNATPIDPTETKNNGSPVPVRSRFSGCLLAGAVGDALGASVEFDSHAQIRARFGDDGITDYAPAYGRIGAITDDTQMTLFTAEGMLRGHVRWSLKGICDRISVVTGAYLRWLATQGACNRHGLGESVNELTGWLVGHDDLHHRRGPGNSCLSSLLGKRSFADVVTDDRKGCGGVMRAAPVGLFGWRRHGPQPLDEVFEFGCATAAITHGHPTGQLSAGVFAALVCLLVDGQDLGTAVQTAIELLVVRDDHHETLAALNKAIELAESDTPRSDAIRSLGQGWIAEEALAIGVYCALVADDIRDGLLLAVNHSGDSDSTGSITGNLLGAQLGQGAIPLAWRDRLELRDVITEVATDLHDYRDWSFSDEAADADSTEHIWHKYPGH